MELRENKKFKPIHIYIIENDQFIEGEKWGNYVKIDQGAGIYNLENIYGHINWSVKNGYDVEVIHDKFENYDD